MDPSALIFIAIAVAWAAYLIPKALEQHEESNRSRGIDTFSHRLRILARREPLSRRRSALVKVTDAVAPAAPEPVPLRDATPADVRAHRRAVAAATRRRRRILDLLLVSTVVVGATVIGGVVAWSWLAVPLGLVVVWLVLCRLAVRGERKRRPVLGEPLTGFVPAVVAVPVEDVVAPEPHVWVDDATGEISAVLPAVASTGTDTDGDTGADAGTGANGWEMMPFVVPTYVVKEQVRRSVRTIDLDSTGVWSSGRSDIDSALVAASDAAKAESADRAGEADDERAAGSAS